MSRSSNASSPPKRFDAELTVRIWRGSPVTGLPAPDAFFDEADDAVRYEIDDQQKGDPQQQDGQIGRLSGNDVPDQRERNDAEQRPPQPMRAAQAIMTT